MPLNNRLGMIVAHSVKSFKSSRRSSPLISKARRARELAEQIARPVLTFLNMLHFFHLLLVGIAKACLFSLHFGLDILKESLKFVHVGSLLWPADPESFGLVRLGDLETPDD